MSDDTLSQDEIDALLGTTGLSEFEGEASDVDIYTLTESLRACVEPSFARLGDRLDTLLQVEVGDARLLSPQEVEPEGEEWILSILRFSEAFDGEFYFLFDPEWSTEVARLGSEGEGGFAAEQMLQALTPHLSAAATGVAEQLSALVAGDVLVEHVGPRRLQLASSVDATPWSNHESLIGFDLTLVAGPEVIGPGFLLVGYESAQVLLARLAASVEAFEGVTAEPTFRPAHPEPAKPASESAQPLVEAATPDPAPTDAPRAPIDVSPPTPPPAEAVEAEVAAAAERRVRRPAPTPSYHAPVFRNLSEGDAAPGGHENIDLLLDVPLQVTVELGRTHKEIREILSLTKGQVIELDKLAGEPVDIFVNGKLIAKGEVVVMDENFGVRITSIVSRMERMQNLQ